MDTQTVIGPSGIFNFLGLPSEIRNRVYQLHLSKEGVVNYAAYDHAGRMNIYDRPMGRLLLGVNILRVCRQIYNEAVPFAYTNRLWGLCGAFAASNRLGIDGVRRLALIPHYTIERVEQIKLDVYIDFERSSCIVASIVMGDLTKLKSLKLLQLFIEMDYLVCLNSENPIRDSPYLVGLVCEILSQIPVKIKVEWFSVVNKWEGDQDEIDAELAYIAHKFRAIKCCDCATSA